MKRVLVLATNLSQASFRVRIAALAPLMAERGYELDVRLRPRGVMAAAKLSHLLRSAGDVHAVIVQRKLLGPMEARAVRRQAHSTGSGQAHSTGSGQARRILYDVDDALMYFNRPVGFISRWRTASSLRATVGVLDHVVAGNEYLAEIFRGQGVGATVVPTMVDSAHYAPKVHAPTQTPRLVWIGSNSTLGYLEKFLPALEQAARQVPGLRLLTIADRTVSSSAIPVEHAHWSERTESADLVRGDIGIAPTPQDQWTLGKCGFKILQYMAAGLPTIASPVGANQQIIEPGVTGLLPATPEEWPAAIAQLANDPDLRARMGKAGRDVVCAKYTLARAADEWARLLGT